MADVYIATSSREGRAEPEVVAIKRVRRELSDDATFLRMFLDEARIARYLQHPGIARVIDMGGHGGSTFLVMEFVPGLNLRTLLERGPLPLHLVAEIIGAVSLALHAAHGQRDEYGEPLNIVHRDVTPMNVMVTFDGRVKLLDFGIAVARGRAEKTQTGIVKGKFSYLSPEQVLGDKIDRRADIFTMGSLLYELVTARRAFTAPNPVRVLRAVATEQPPPPTSFNPDIPPELVSITARCLKKRREERFQNALELSHELEAMAGMWNLVAGTSDQVSLSQYLKEQFKDRKAALDLMLDHVRSVAKTSVKDVPEIDGTPIPAPYEERAGDLESPSEEPPLPEKEDRGPHEVGNLTQCDERVEDFDEHGEDREQSKTLLYAILIGVLIGCALAVVIWFFDL